MRPILRPCLALMIIFALTACGGGGGGGDGGTSTTSSAPESQIVGPSGGTLSFAGGAVTMNVPAGAVSSDMTITVQRSSSAPGSSTMIPTLSYTFGPEGTIFSTPVYLTIHYNPGDIPTGVAASDLRICKVSSGAWIGLTASTVDTAAHTVTGLLTGFSTYGVGTAPLTPPAPPSIPVLPAGFGSVINDPAQAGDATQIAIGTAANDLITQYGGTGNTTESATGGGGNDWILQSCSGTSCSESANIGSGNTIVYQFSTSPGPSAQGASGVGSGNHTFIQVGGQGTNVMSVDDSASGGSAHIEQYGGSAGNTMEAQGSAGNDLIAMYGGAGNDTITYDMTNGTDTVIINGGGGTDALIVNTQGETNYTIKNGSGTVLTSSGAGGTTITVVNVESITVRDAGNNVIFSWP